jgi:hypothetical protein
MQSSEEVAQQPSVKYVIKRDGTRQILNIEKIRSRFVNKGAGLNAKFINYDVIVHKVTEGIYQGKFLLSQSLPKLTTLFFRKLSMVQKIMAPCSHMPTKMLAETPSLISLCCFTL